MKTKTCHCCGKEVPKLWRSRPFPTCQYCAKVQDYQTSLNSKGTKTSQKKKKPISPISEKMKVRLKEYRVLRDKYMQENKVCEICKVKPSSELHHKVSRRYALCDVGVFMALCNGCHSRIEREDSWARENGYKLSIHDYKK